MIHVDTLIENGLLVTMDDKAPIIMNGALCVKDGVIVDIGTGSELRTKYQAAKIIDAHNKLVMPGLVNAHTHAAMSLFRGLADDAPLKEWLEEYIWPAEKAFMDVEGVALGTHLAMIEMLLTGTTTFNDMYFYADHVASAAKHIGMRAVVSEGVMDVPLPFRKSPEEATRNTEKLIKKWQGDRLVNVAIGSHSPFNCSPELLKRQKELSQEYGVPLHIHVAETRQEVMQSAALTQLTPVGYLNSLGFLGPNVMAVHCVHLTDEDIQLLADHEAGVVHNPVSNAKLGSGVAPVSKLLKEGATVAIGTDGAASNNRNDLFYEMSAAALLAKVGCGNPGAEPVTAYNLVKMATIGGAQVLGMSDKIGSLEIGKRADLILVQLNKPNMTPMYDVFSHLVYAASSENVDTVMVDGHVLLENRELRTVDAASILDQSRMFANRVRTLLK